MSAKTVFISYRRDATGKSFARSIKEALTHHGYDVFLDVDCVDAGKWAAQILTQVPKRSHFLLLLTPGALDRCTQEEDWVRKEFLNAVAHRRNIVPVREESVNLTELRTSCAGCMKPLFDYQTATIQHGSFERDIDALIDRYIPPHKAPAEKDESAVSNARNIPADISRIIKYAPAELIGREEELKLLNDAWAGRAELPLRPDIGAAQQRRPTKPKILTFVALGGEGKTSLVAKWTAELAAQDWPDCDAVFAWSFYSQGTREQLAASSDLFLKEALTFFALDDKDREFAASPAGAFEKGQRLARLVGQRRSLLILDGLEPLQYAPTAPTPGQLKDQGIAALLKGLAQNSHGLCIVTTRYSLPDLKTFWQTTAPEVKLLRLSRDAGVHLLKSFDVRGSDRKNIPFNNGKERLSEFEKLVEDVKGHALTLNLLGSYLRDAHGGDIRKRDLVKLEEADAEIVIITDHPNHLFHVLDAYVKWLETGGAPVADPARKGGSEHAGSETGTPNAMGQRALAILRLAGLFDRPVTDDCFGALLKAPAISSLTEPLVELNEAQRNMVLKRLEEAKLLTVNRDTSGALLSLDAHPHLREYFARQLRTQQPDAWRAAHRRLYEHLCATTKEGDQPTLEDLQPLYQAVAHGCQAGLQQKACDDVYFARIARVNESYSARILGALGSDLGAEACFFDQPWSRVSPAITEADQAWLLNETAFRLRALGRLAEALEPMRAGIKGAVKLKDWINAAIYSSNLSELDLTLGEVVVAVGAAEQSVTYADRSGDAFWKMGTRTIHADGLHQGGHRAEAETRFRETEQMQAEHQPDYPLLYSLQGFRYCDLVLAASERAAWQTILSFNCQPSTLNPSESCRAVSRRAAQTLKWTESDPGVPVLTLALDHLTLGRAALYAAILERSAAFTPLRHVNESTAPNDDERQSDLKVALQTAHRELDAAVDGLRRAGQAQELPRGLFSRAWLRFLLGARTGLESAQEDLDEAWEIAERGPMRLFMADIHLYRARLFFREKEYPWQSPQHDLAEARKLIEKCGYGRRKEELEDAEKAILGTIVS